MFRAAVDPKKKSSEMRAWRILPANARNDHRPKTNANCPCVRPHSRESALCSKFLVLLFLLLGLLHGFLGSFVSVILCVKDVEVKVTTVLPRSTNGQCGRPCWTRDAHVRLSHCHGNTQTSQTPR